MWDELHTDLIAGIVARYTRVKLCLTREDIGCFLDCLGLNLALEHGRYDLLDRNLDAILSLLLVFVLILGADPSQSIQDACRLRAEASKVDSL